MAKRVFNFSAGPAVLPVSVLEEAQRDLVAMPGHGMSVMEMSHRSKAFIAIMEQTEADLRQLMAIPDSYRVLFLHGGSRLQFSMVPMNLLGGKEKSADYIVTGSWGNNALKEAKREGNVNLAWDGKATHYDRLPEPADVTLDSDASYVHFTSNETIQGVQFGIEPPLGDAPWVCDASSDILSRPLPIEKYGLIYACAQKNAGPAGVTVVIVRDDLLQRSPESLPGMLSYRTHAEKESALNTPPCFALYMVGLIAKWLKDEVGGLEAMHERNKQKASLLYDVLDQSEGFFKGHAKADCRSLMNVTFRLPTEELEKQFLDEAAACDLVSLKGHRSVGGIRASIYNAMPVEGVEALRNHMLAFQAKHAGQKV